MNRRRASCFVVVALLLALGACQTTPSDEGDREPKVRPGQIIAFAPIEGQAPIQFASGAYADLFEGKSHATWDAGAGNGMVEIACYLSSVFADTSIAYDVVGFRGIDVYVVTPDGKEVPPVQVMVGSELEEEQRGALNQFARTNRVFFSQDALRFTLPPDGSYPPPLRLVLEGLDSEYHFAWKPIIPPNLGSPPFSERASVKATKEKGRRMKAQAGEISHTFD